MNTKLTIKNFRVFDEDGETVDLKPITVLTGCNSSGKSSVVKAALMLNDVWRQLKPIVKGEQRISVCGIYFTTYPSISASIDFTTYPNNLLGRFDKVLHNSKNGKITFEYTIYSYLISKDVTVTLDFVADKSSKLNGAYLEKFEVKSEDGIIFWMEQNKAEETRKAEFAEANQMQTVAFGTVDSFDDYYEEHDEKTTTDSVSCSRRVNAKTTTDSVSYSRRVNVNLVRNQFIEYAVFKNLDSSFTSNWHSYEFAEFSGYSEDKYKKDKERLQSLLKDNASRYHLVQQRWEDICKSKTNSICNKDDVDIIERVKQDNSLFYIPVMEELDKIGKNNVENFVNENGLADFIQSYIGEKDVDTEIVKGYIKDVIVDFLSSNEITFSEYFKQLETEYFNNALFEKGSAELNKLGFLDFGRLTLFSIPTEIIWKHKHKFEKAYCIVMFLNQKLRSEDSKFFKCAIDGFRHKSAEMLEDFLIALFTECMVPSFSGPMTYVSSARATIKRLYQLDKKDDFTVLLKAYMESNHKGTFINKWVKKFGIGDSVSFAMDEDGVGAKIRIHKTPDDETGRLLADEGYGITQLLSIMLQIQMTNSYDENIVTIAVEEPEIHLHPKYQSLLADMFVDAYQKGKIHFIIETHSEYLIRRLQLLVAGIETEKKLDKNDVSIAYIYTKDEAEKENQPRVKNIAICEDGYLDDTFGSGFFDEATSLSRKLM
ncbi:MAG: DUF3696 domain-containing protein [Bacteroidales bacterium]|nr:DUF3696 domain-containing protein [Bacteroidales bacterium]